MAATQITLVIDRQNRVLIQYGSAVAQLPALSQCDIINFLIQIADPPSQTLGGAPTIITTADVSGGAPRVTVAQKATSILANQPPNILAYTYEAGWAWNAGLQGFTGTLNLNTLQMQTFLAGAESGQVEFEVRFSSGGILNTILPGPDNRITVLANDDPGAAPPITILNGVQLLYAPLQIKFPSGNLYAVSETGDGHLSFDLVPP